jgi:hypothetical protein
LIWPGVGPDWDEHTKEIDPEKPDERAVADLKIAVKKVLSFAPREVLTNAEIGRSLRSNAGHIERELGHSAAGSFDGR